MLWRVVSPWRVSMGALVHAVLGASLVPMVEDAAHGGDWPGWDEGWAVVVFPVGIPAAVGAGGEALRAVGGRIIVLVTGAVWLLGAAVALWFVVGD